jgi:hypothetical protein
MVPLSYRPRNAHEVNLRVSRRGPFFKVLVFRTPAALRRFWKREFRYPGEFVGIVRGATMEKINAASGETVGFVRDPRFFAVVGLCLDYMGSEILAHESVHIGFAWCAWHGFPATNEENVAYPAGLAMRRMVRSLFDKTGGLRKDLCR